MRNFKTKSFLNVNEDTISKRSSASLSGVPLLFYAKVILTERSETFRILECNSYMLPSAVNETQTAKTSYVVVVSNLSATITWRGPLHHSHKNSLVWKRTIAYCFNFSMLGDQQQQPASVLHRIWAFSFTEKFSNEAFWSMQVLRILGGFRWKWFQTKYRTFLSNQSHWDWRNVILLLRAFNHWVNDGLNNPTLHFTLAPQS